MERFYVEKIFSTVAKSRINKGVRAKTSLWQDDPIIAKDLLTTKGSDHPRFRVTKKLKEDAEFYQQWLGRRPCKMKKRPTEVVT